MDKRARDLIEQGDYLFGKRGSLLSMWQEIADNFYPERGQFTTTPYLGQDFASNLVTSYPLLARRDLGNSFSAMLRPPGQEWFKIAPAQVDVEDTQSRAWLEEMTLRQRRAMYDPAACFTRATKEGDHDFAAFGQCAITVEFDQRSQTLLYRCWHLADMAWCESAAGKIDTVHRKWKVTARELCKLFPDTVGQVVKTKAADKPYEEINVRHVVTAADNYGEMDKKARRLAFVSIYIDVDNKMILEEKPQYQMTYVIPRWQTVSGSQYAHSPATIAALPDARLIQAMTFALLEAGEKAARPPMIGVTEAIRGDIDLRAGGYTAIEADYDERGGEALRPLQTEWRGVPIGVEMSDRVVAMIKQSFFLDKLTPMPMGNSPTMTAFEVGQRVQDWMRQAIPLFEPMEAEYNGALCNSSFDLLLRAGLFGAAKDIPKELQGQEIQFRFQSPLSEAIERKKGQQFLEAKQMLAEAAALDPSAPAIMDAQVAIRDALQGIGMPAKWMRDEKAVAEIAAQRAEAQQGQESMDAAQQGADIAATMGKAVQGGVQAAAASPQAIAA